MNTVEAFKEFYAANPHVYAALVRLARQAKDAGYKKLGMKQLFEVLRWEFTVLTKDHTGFKLNNNYTAPYARIIMYREPDLAGFFEIRGGNWVPDVEGGPRQQSTTPSRRKLRQVTRRAGPSRKAQSEQMRSEKPVFHGAVRGVPGPKHMALPERALDETARKMQRGKAQSKSAPVRAPRPRRTPEEIEELRRRAEEQLEARIRG